MIESKGKSVARCMLYRECLPEWLLDEQLRSGNYLVLLGDEPRELPYLDEWHVPRRNVYSVERELRVYDRQFERNLGVNLYRGEMREYLEYLLHSNQRLLVLNMDVEGSYRTQLDPAMTPVLLFCWKNPETVVVTHSSIGRDTEMLWEGIKSLSLFLWLSQETTRELFLSLVARYERAGFTEPVRMALRDCFWLRSVLEHTVISTTVVGMIPVKYANAFFEASSALWNIVVDKENASLSLERMESVLREKGMLGGGMDALRTLPIAGIRVAAIKHVIYNAERPWSQRCYFAKFESSGEVADGQHWFERAVVAFLNAPLAYVNREGLRTDLADGSGATTLAARIPFLERAGTRKMYKLFSPRIVPVRLPAPDLARMIQFRLSANGGVRRGENVNHNEDQKTPKGVNEMSNRQRANGNRLVENGRPTEHGITMIHKMSRGGMSTAEIMRMVPAFGKLQERVIRAHVAVARREPAKAEQS